MARPSRPWFRLYVEIVADPKIRRLSPDHRWFWIALLAAARMSPVPGVLLVTDQEPYSDRDLADFAGLPLRVVSAGLALFERLGLIERGEEGTWEIPSWAERQYESDSSTERTAQTRSKKRSKNGDNPLPGTTVSVSVSGLSTEEKGAAFDEFYALYPRHVGKPAAQNAFLKALKRAPLEAIMAGTRRYATDPNRDPEFTAHPSTWLNQDRWDDDALPVRSMNGRAPTTSPRRVKVCVGCGKDLSRETAFDTQEGWKCQACR